MTDWTYIIVAVVAGIVLWGCMWFQERRVKLMTEIDKAYKKTEEDGPKKKTQDGRSRSRWDYSSIPTLQRMGMKVDPRLILASLLLLTLTTIWLFTKEDTFLDLVKVNFGALLGSLIAVNDKNENS